MKATYRMWAKRLVYLKTVTLQPLMTFIRAVMRAMFMKSMKLKKYTGFSFRSFIIFGAFLFWLIVLVNNSIQADDNQNEIYQYSPAPRLPIK